jgi:mono/diheme cytochrome c family protein
MKPLSSLPALLFFAPVCLRAAEIKPVNVMHERHRGLLKENCEGCHGAEKQKGKFRVDDLSLALSDPQTAERWQKILDAINSGEMPPPEEKKQLGKQEKADFLDDLSQVMVAARRTLNDQHGKIAMRRLNQREYKNTLRVLLGADVDVSELPSDTDAARFDTVGTGLFMSGNQVEQYESIAMKALEEAFALRAAAGVQKKFRYEVEETNQKFKETVAAELDKHERASLWVKAVDEAAAKPENAEIVAELRKNSKNDSVFRRSWKSIPGAPAPEEFGFNTSENNTDQANRAFARGPSVFAYQMRYLAQPALDTGAYLTIQDQDGGSNSALFVNIPGDFPPGDYIIRVRAGVTPQATPDRRFLDFGFKGRSRPVTSVHEVTGTLEAPSVIEIPFHRTWVHRDQNAYRLYVREKGTADSNEQIKQKLDQGRKLNGIAPDFAIWVDWIEIERIPETEGETPPGIRALDIALDDKTPAPKLPELRAALERFAIEAFRGSKPTERYLDRLVRLYEESRSDGTRHSMALKETLSVVLASPKFLYRAEPSPAEERRKLQGNEIATRLSYFLWGTPPDATLRALGEGGTLLQPAVLAEQTNRLLDDPRSMEFVKAFSRQWLNLDRLDFFQFSAELHPKFDFGTKWAARQEVHETLACLLRENASVRDLLKADYVVVNSLLADYYGLEGVQGDAFRKVPLPPNSPRGGLLGMAAVLAMGGNGEHTSPVERGAWVLRKVLNEPPPPAPANVPALTRLAGKVLTTRERVSAHQEEAQCASCHRRIDPIGFGLENFDAAGLWRTEDSFQARDNDGKPLPNAKKTWIIDPAGTFHRGPAFRDFNEMRDVVASRTNAFARGLASSLIEYGLGRPCGFSDDALVEAIVQRAQKQNLGLREFLHALVQSEAFQSK